MATFRAWWEIWATKAPRALQEIREKQERSANKDQPDHVDPR